MAEPHRYQKGHKPYSKGGAREGAGRKLDEAKKEVKELAGAYTVEALERLAYWMRSEHASASVAAANALLDRGHNKPGQAVEHTGKIQHEMAEEEKKFIRDSIQEFICKP